MALFHFHVGQIKRSKGQSAVAAAAYRAGEKLYSDYYGEYSDFTRKGGVICSEILLPPQAPAEYQVRSILWNAVEKAEHGKKAQLAYSFDIALQNELTMEENIALARRFLMEQFVSKGMVVDFAVHAPDKKDGGPHPSHRRKWAMGKETAPVLPAGRERRSDFGRGRQASVRCRAYNRLGKTGNLRGVAGGMGNYGERQV